MSDKPRILFIVEGERLEPEFIEQMTSVYGPKCEIAAVCTNIHSLYRKLKEDDGGFLDVIAVLKELFRKKIESLESGLPDSKQSRQLHKTRNDLEKLNHKFASTYLVFDSEMQHSERGGSVSQEERLEKNCGELKDMIAFFDNETEQGKLFINYPMMESYRDCDDFFDESYKERTVSLDILFAGRYKEETGRRKLSGIKISKITRQEFDKLIRMNIYKLNYIANKDWSGMNYEFFRELSKQHKILTAEQKIMKKENALAVLNTLLFFPVDYFGLDLYNEIK